MDDHVHACMCLVTRQARRHGLVLAHTFPAAAEPRTCENGESYVIKIVSYV